MDLQDKVALGAAMFGTPSVNTGASTMLAEVVSDAKDGEVGVWMRDEEGNEQKVEIPCDGDLREGDVATVIVQDGRATAISAGGAGERSKAETEAAQQAASTAQTAAETAQTDATQAKTDAADAKETAAGAETAAGEAKDAAADATQAASDAQSAADTAKSAADAATSAAADASTKADNAASAATEAGTKADAASTKADAAGTKADAASSAATKAQDAATKAQDAATDAGTKADNAASAATKAQTDATNAAKVASDATDAATKAQTDATNAAKVASDATDAAKAAKTTAETAQTTAQTANDTAAAAQTAVAATKQHFWADDEGAHVATTAHEEGAAITGSNLLATAGSVQIRDGETKLADFDSHSVNFYSNYTTPAAEFSVDAVSLANGKFALSSWTNVDYTDTEYRIKTHNKIVSMPPSGQDEEAYIPSGTTLDIKTYASLSLTTQCGSGESTVISGVVDDNYGGLGITIGDRQYGGKTQISGGQLWLIAEQYNTSRSDEGAIRLFGNTMRYGWNDFVPAVDASKSTPTLYYNDAQGQKHTFSTALAAYPVGSIYMSVNSTSPADLFGGTWEEIAGGRVLMGQNSTYTAGTTGGSATHTHTGPAHTHTYGIGYGMHYGAMVNYLNTGQLQIYNKGAWANTPSKTNTTDVTFATPVANATGRTSKSITRIRATAETTSGGNGNTGSASSLPPYLAVYMWKRTA